MKNIILRLITVMLTIPFNLSGQGSVIPGKNNVITRIPLIATAASSDIDALDIRDKQEKVEYYDGLSRRIQTNFKQATGDWQGNDLIYFYQYDEFGRTSKNYLPYKSASSDGSYQANAFNDQIVFYQNASAVAHDNITYGETTYDKSPLNAVEEIAFPGHSWKNGSNHTITQKTTFNQQSEVLLWEINYDAAGTPTGASAATYFASGELFKNVKTDENGKTTAEYIDKQGKILCRKIVAYTDANNLTKDFTQGSFTQNGGSDKDYYFYSIYDDFGRIVYTVPYKALILMGNFSFNDNNFSSNTIFKEFIYAYHYDEKGRVFEKHIPNAGWFSFVFNNFDRVILSQDPRQKSNNKWIYKKYDEEGAEVIWGEFFSTDTREMLQNQQRTETKFYETRNNALTDGYSNNCFPRGNVTVFGVNYYDNYNFSFDNTLNAISFQPWNGLSSTNNVTGLLTGCKIRILNTTNFLYSVTFYDDKGLVLQEHKQQFVDYPNTWDVFNNEYDFTGKVIENTRNHTSFGNLTKIRTRFFYDHMGRLVDIYKQINGETEIHMVYNQFNDIGQLIKKNLHFDWNWPDDYMQHIDYRYNIRGWLSSINNATLTSDGGVKNNDNNDVFGEELYYDNPDITNSQFQSLPQYNGNIAAIKWRSKTFSSNIDYAVRPVRSYTYRYDDLDRLTAAYYASCKKSDPDLFEEDINMYDEKQSYDMSGNILALYRNSKAGNTDDLTYTYYNQGNQIASVADASPSLINNDFKDGANISNEYIYDENGNMMHDENKQLTTEYNFLNLPANISVGGTGVQYVYDAAGTKLARIYNGITNTYNDGIEYKNDELQFILTEEGRVRPKNKDAQNTDAHVYDYFIKDHLGNVRVTITNEILYKKYMATMEDVNDLLERQFFDNVPETRSDKPAAMPQDASFNPDLKVSGLDPDLGSPIGHAKVLEVTSGDKVSIDTKYYFSGNPFVATNDQTVQQIVTQLAGIFFPGFGMGTLNAEQLEIAQQTFTSNTDLIQYLSATINSNNPPNGKPKAFLTWLMFNKDLKLVTEASGVLRAETPDQLGTLGILDIDVPENGFMYIYVSNETGGKAVDFDNLQINHVPGYVMEENHYYPFGLLIQPISYAVSWRSPANSYKYNSIELENELAQNIYGAEFRNLDPVLGRWWQVDPLAENFMGITGYNSNFNDPVYYTDPRGDNPLAIVAAGIIGGIANTLGHLNQINNAGGTWDKVKLGHAYFTVGFVAGVAAVITTPCTTCGIVLSSFVLSVGNKVVSNGEDEFVLSFGAASYNATNTNWGYLGEQGNSLMTNIGYGLGLLAVASDFIPVSLFLKDAQPSDAPPPPPPSDELICMGGNGTTDTEKAAIAATFTLNPVDIIDKAGKIQKVINFTAVNAALAGFVLTLTPLQAGKDNQWANFPGGVNPNFPELRDTRTFQMSKGGDRMKGERNKTGKADGTDNPWKHTKQDPNDPGKIIVKDPHTGKSYSKPKPPGWKPR